MKSWEGDVQRPAKSSKNMGDLISSRVEEIAFWLCDAGPQRFRLVNRSSMSTNETVISILSDTEYFNSLDRQVVTIIEVYSSG